MWEANPTGAGTDLRSVWNGVPALLAGVQTNAATSMPVSSPNSPAANGVYPGSNSRVHGRTIALHQHPV